MAVASAAGEVFGQRQREQDAWNAVAEAMREGLRVGGAAGLQAALNMLNRTGHVDFKHPVKNVFRRNVEQALDGQQTCAGSVRLGQARSR